MHRPHRITRRTARRLVLCAIALAGAFVAPARGDTGGALLYNDGHKIVRFDLATRRESAIPVSDRSTEMLGWGGGVATDVEVVKRPDQYTVKLLRGGAVTALPPFSISRGHVSGPVRPSPSATLFVLHTRETAGLGEPIVDHVYVFDGASHVKARFAGY